MLGLNDLPITLRRYLIIVSVVGPLAALATAVISGAGRGLSDDLGWAALLTLLAFIAECHPIHLTHKTKVNVAGAVYVAMFLALPTALPGLLALIAIAAGQARRRADLIEIIFNGGQGALYVTVGAVVYTVARDVGPLGPPMDPLGSVGAVVVAAFTLHLVNTALVAGAASLQLRLSFVRTWTHTIALDLLGHTTLSTLGTLGAVLILEQPLLLPVLVLPVVFVHHALEKASRGPATTHATLASLVDIVEMHDPYTAGHSRRVAATARALALRLGMAPEEAAIVEQAGNVHDIGKASLDVSVLGKPGPLGEKEWTEMRRHPVHGANVLERFPIYQQCAELVRHHHEHWDGSGYPDGLRGEAIPFGARILAVADTLDALTSDRPYRTALSVEAACRILEQGAGRQWDPQVVRAIVDHLRATTGELGEIVSSQPAPVSLEPRDARAAG